MRKIVLLVMLGSLLSCNLIAPEEHIELCPNPINASIKEKKLVFGKDVYIIKTENAYGWLYSVIFNKEDRYKPVEDISNRKMPYTIKAPEFSIEVIDKHTLEVRMNKNSTDEENVLIIGLQAQHCYDRIEIVQPLSEE